jgi:hypothetical protein
VEETAAFNIFCINPRTIFFWPHTSDLHSYFNGRKNYDNFV